MTERAAFNASSYLTAAGGLLANATATRLAATAAQQSATAVALDVYFVVHAAALVFFMQAGFAMLTAGSVRSKNTKNVLLKNLLDACVCALAYWVFGYAFAFGRANEPTPGTAHAFIGSGPFALSGAFGEKGPSPGLARDPAAGLHDFFFQLAFAATATTIVSGAVAERTSFYAYLAYAFFLSGFVYPVVAHWIWGDGFLARLLGDRRGVLDFAGCAVVHTVGGFAGLAGSLAVGPRLGRFDSEGQPVSIPGHSAPLATIGTFCLWFGWYGFNPGSALRLSEGGHLVAERCAVTTTLAAAAAGVVTLAVLKMRDHYFDLISCLNGILAGLVSITASCAFVEPYAAVVIGGVGALVYIFAAKLLLQFRVDDPLEAFPIHGACGVWGLVAVGLFSVERFVALASKSELHGAFYGGGGMLLGANIAGAIVVVVWTVGLIGGLFLVMKQANILRISPEEELIGNDMCKHGGVAYHLDADEEAERAAVQNLQISRALSHGGSLGGSLPGYDSPRAGSLPGLDSPRGGSTEMKTRSVDSV